MSLLGSAILGLALIGTLLGVLLTLTTGRVPSRYERFRFARAAQPIRYWATVALYLACIANLLWAEKFI